MTSDLGFGQRVTKNDHARQLQTLAGGFGMTVRVFNDGHHVEMRGAGLLFEWWPSTGRYMVNKVSQRPGRLSTLNDVRRQLEHLQKHPPKTPAPQGKAKRTPDSGVEFVPDQNLRCDSCGRPGAMPFCKLCSGCKFGPVRFSQ